MDGEEEMGLRSDPVAVRSRGLTRQAGWKVFFILDGLPVQRAATDGTWLQRHAERIELFYLPAYSPHLNPDEVLNQDVKTNAVGRY